MKKNPLIILFFVFTLLLVAFIGTKALMSRSESNKTAKKIEHNSVISTGEISSLEYSLGDLKLSFSKNDGLWSCNEYVGYPINQSTLELISTGVSSLQAVRILDEHGAPSEYGLTSPSAVISVKDLDGITRSLTFGDTTESGNFYLSVSGDERIFVVTCALIDALPTDILSLVDCEKPPVFAQADVKAIKLTIGSDEYAYTKTALTQTAENGTAYEWLCEKNGVSVEPLFENVETAAYDLSNLTLDGCLEYLPDASAATLYPEPYAKLEVTVNTADGEESFTLTFCEIKPDDETKMIVACGESHCLCTTNCNSAKEIVSLLKSA